jgi:hypothetical protein
MTTPAAYFTRQGDAFVPAPIAKGPWGQTVSGNFVGGLLAHAVAEAFDDPGFQPARFTVDLLRPVALEPVLAHCEAVREGKRLKLFHVKLSQTGTIVAQASALLLRRGEQPPGAVWSSTVTMPPLPPEPDDPRAEASMMVWAFGKRPELSGPSFDLTEWGHDGPKFVWLRDRVPLVEGHEVTPFVRVAMAGDVASSLTHYGTDGLCYINADYTLTLSRVPVGVAIGLAALTHHSVAGVATGTAAVFDADGPIGTATATALANPGFAPRPG